MSPSDEVLTSSIVFIDEAGSGRAAPLQAYTQIHVPNRIRDHPFGLAEMQQNDVVWHASLISLEQREAANGHPAAAVWFTGPPR